MQTPPPLSLLLLFLTLTLSSGQPPPSDALSLLYFKSQADLDSKLPFSLQTRSNFCHWLGVKCLQNRVIRFNLQSSGLRGTLSPKLNQLTNLRVLSLRNNSLSGPIPDLSGLTNLKTLFLDRNMFSGSFPVSILSLHTLLFLDLSHNNLAGSIPVQITGLDLLTYLRFDSNRFNGSFPPINQTYLKTFNASSNEFSGAVPVTASLSRFPLSSFSNNPSLCGAIIHVECRYNSTPPFFFGPNASVVATSPPPALSESTLSPPFLRNHRRVGVVLGTVLGALVVATALLCGITFCRSLKSKREAKSEHRETLAETNTKLVSEITENKRTEKSKLVFCEENEKGIYTLDELMRASAELLGRGTVGTTYKAVMDGGRVAVSVKRLDSGKVISDEVLFEGHMELVGGLRHPNLVPVRAYFQANEERLIVYDYQPNGSLFNLIHGSRSTRAKPLHWTSCLKIADDVAQGLAYIHQASRLVHGNLKSTNVLVGADFEACLTDYCLSTLLDSTSITLDLDSERYRAPEMRISTRVIFNPKSDVYAFGVLLLELLTGKIPSQHPYLDPTDMNDWVRAMRGGDDVEEDDRLEMLVQVARVCSSRSPEQRPSSRQVLKMIQDIKERVVVEDDTRNRYFAY